MGIRFAGNVTLVGLMLWLSPVYPAWLVTLPEGLAFLGMMAIWGASEWVMLWRMAKAVPPSGQPVAQAIRWIDRGVMVGIILALTVSLRKWDGVVLTGLARSTLIAMGFIGVGLRVWAIRTLGARFSSRVMGENQVKDGPYQWLAHPGYLGLLLVLLSLVGLLRSTFAALIILCGIAPLLWWRGWRERLSG